MSSATDRLARPGGPAGSCGHCAGTAPGRCMRSTSPPARPATDGWRSTSPAAGCAAPTCTSVAGDHPRAVPGLVLGHELERHPRRRCRHCRGPARGTPVVVNPLLPCGHCATCLAGRPHTCANLKLLGIDARVGRRSRSRCPRGRWCRCPRTPTSTPPPSPSRWPSPSAPSAAPASPSGRTSSWSVPAPSGSPSRCARGRPAPHPSSCSRPRPPDGRWPPGSASTWPALPTTLRTTRRTRRPGRRRARGVRLRLAPGRGGPARRPRRTGRPRRGGRDLSRPHPRRPAGRLVQGARGDRHAGVLPGRPATPRRA